MSSVTTLGGRPLIRTDIRGTSLCVSVDTPKSSELKGNEVLVNGKPFKLAEVGFHRAEVEAGTAYHVPEGMLLANGLNAAANVPAKINAEDAKSLILGWAGL